MLIPAMIMDLFLKDPSFTLHPIAIIGRFIACLDKRVFHRHRTYISGLCIVLLSVLLFILPVHVFVTYLKELNNTAYLVFCNLLVFFLLCEKTLLYEAKEIKKALDKNDIALARKRVGRIVGRDTSQLNAEEITKATIESLAENTVDGLVAPIFYGIIGIPFGLSVELMLLFKIINTLDSMLGYKNEQYRKIGFFSAKIDDLFGLIPARLGAIIMLGVGAMMRLDVRKGLQIYRRDRYKHLSPNSAHSEAVVAGLLGVQLGGTHLYFGEVVEKDTIGDNENIVEKAMIQTASYISLYTDIGMILIYLILEVV